MRKIRALLIILIIINICALAYLLIMPKIDTYTYTMYAVEHGKEENPSTDESNTKEIISFENEYILLSNYIGEIPTGNVNLKFTDLLNTGFAKFYSDTKEMGKAELTNYLEANSSDIAMQTGITHIEDFEKFIQKIQIYQNEDIICQKSEIVQDSYVNGNDYDTFKVQLSYSNGQSIIFNVSLSNRDFIETPLIIIK